MTEFINESNERIISSNLEHIQDDKKYLLEIKRVLKTGGIFILTTPNRMNRLKPGQKPWNPYHVREYYPNELNNLLQSVFREVCLKSDMILEDASNWCKMLDTVKKPKFKCAKQKEPIATWKTVTVNTGTLDEFVGNEFNEKSKGAIRKS